MWWSPSFYPAAETSMPLTNVQLLTNHKMDLIAQCRHQHSRDIPGAAKIISALTLLQKRHWYTIHVLLGFRGKTTVKNLGTSELQLPFGQIAFNLISILIEFSTDSCLLCTLYNEVQIRGQTGFIKVWDNVKVTSRFWRRQSVCCNYNCSLE